MWWQEFYGSALGLWRVSVPRRNVTQLTITLNSYTLMTLNGSFSTNGTFHAKCCHCYFPTFYVLSTATLDGGVGFTLTIIQSVVGVGSMQNLPSVYSQSELWVNSILNAKLFNCLAKPELAIVYPPRKNTRVNELVLIPAVKTQLHRTARLRSNQTSSSQIASYRIASYHIS